MKRLITVTILTILIMVTGCAYVSVPVISEPSQPNSSVISTVSEISETSSTGSDLDLPSCEFCLTTEYTFEVNVMTTSDWQSYEGSGDDEIKTFTLTFPENWIRDAADAPTFHDQYTDIKIFESIAAVKLPAGFDFAGSFHKENFEDPISGATVFEDVRIGTLMLADGEKTYAMVVQSVVPEGGGEIQIDHWYPYFCVIKDGDYAYCFQFYSLDDPTFEDIDGGLFMEIMNTFRPIS